MPLAAAQGDTQREVIPGRQRDVLVFPCGKVHLRKLRPGAVIRSLLRKIFAAGFFYVRQQAADLLHRLLPGAAPGKLRAVFLQDIVPYLQLHRLVVFAVAVRRDMQPQHLLRYLVALPGERPETPQQHRQRRPCRHHNVKYPCCHKYLRSSMDFPFKGSIGCKRYFIQRKENKSPGAKLFRCFS